LTLDGGRRRDLAHDPGVELPIWLFQQGFELSSSPVVMASRWRSAKGQDQVGLADAPMPGAILQLAATRIHERLGKEEPI